MFPFLIINLLLPLGAIDPDTPIRTESEVRLAAEKVIAQYEDKQILADGFLDATKAPYHADPTGKTDSTAAIQRAIKDARDAQVVTYLPAGRYLVSDTIEGIEGIVTWDDWPYEGWSDPWVDNDSFSYPCVLMGPREGKRATLVLNDNAPGFGDPKNPKPVLYFWARHSVKKPLTPRSNINFNQRILHLNFDLGTGNPGGVAINHRGAEGASIEDIGIQAHGAFAGIFNAPGSGGAIHGITVRGGKYGFYFQGTQPSPMVSDVTFKEQTTAAIFYKERGPLTIVGANIEGKGITTERSWAPWNGSITLIDSIIRLKDTETAIDCKRSLVLSHVWFHNAKTIAVVGETTRLSGRKNDWVHVEEYAAGARANYPGYLNDLKRQDTVWIDQEKQEKPYAVIHREADAPDAELLTQHRYPVLPAWDGEGTVNVRDAPFHAKGDGQTDDYAALQAAIDKHDIIFLPKGRYCISQPLTLRSSTTLFGPSTVFTTITPLEGAETFLDPNNPRPLIQTVNDPDATSTLAMLRLELPVLNPCVYALNWRAGRNSVVQNIYPIRTSWHPNAPSYGLPMFKIEGNGGGRWYTQTLLHWWAQNPYYRHLLVTGTHEPLRFYHLQPQHARSDAQIEMFNAKNIDIYSMKTEGDVPMLWLRHCSDIRVFGVGGIIAPFPGNAAIKVDSCRNLLLANINPQITRGSHWGALGIHYEPNQWLIMQDGGFRLGGLEQFAYYKLNGDALTVPSP